MAIYSRAEFCKLVGIKQPALSTQISRGKIVVFEENGKQKIDDSVRANADFIKQQQMTNALKEAKEVTNSESIVNIDSTQNKKVKVKAEKTQMTMFDLLVEEKRANIDKKLVDTRLSEMKVEVLVGANIPINQVKTIVSTLSKSILTNHNAFLNQLISEFCHQHKVSDAERSKMLVKSMAGLNAIHLKAVSESKIQMKNASSRTQTTLALEEDEL